METGKEKPFVRSKYEGGMIKYQKAKEEEKRESKKRQKEKTE